MLIGVRCAHVVEYIGTRIDVVDGITSSVHKVNKTHAI
jgi:hypothetical protein